MFIDDDDDDGMHGRHCIKIAHGDGDGDGDGGGCARSVHIVHVGFLTLAQDHAFARWPPAGAGARG